ncbi:MAG: serpin family protein [Psychrobacter sp.]|nr:serpin family protein [Psychrobacter sp.]
MITVDSVIHKVLIEVDEKGTAAAVATAIVVNMTSTSYNAEFKASHPLMFMIKDNKTDTIFFLAQANKPEV